MTDNMEQQDDIVSISLLALEFHRARCFHSLAELCTAPPKSSDMRLTVALKILGQRNLGRKDFADPEAITAQFKANLEYENRPTVDELLAQILAAVGAEVSPDEQQETDRGSTPKDDPQWAHLPPPPILASQPNLPPPPDLPAPPVTNSRTRPLAKDMSSNPSARVSDRPEQLGEVAHNQSQRTPTPQGNEFSFSRLASNTRKRTITDFSRQYKIDIVWLLAVANDQLAPHKPLFATTELNPALEDSLRRLLDQYRDLLRSL